MGKFFFKVKAFGEVGFSFDESFIYVIFRGSWLSLFTVLSCQEFKIVYDFFALFQVDFGLFFIEVVFFTSLDVTYFNRLLALNIFIACFTVSNLLTILIWVVPLVQILLVSRVLLCFVLRLGIPQLVLIDHRQKGRLMFKVFRGFRMPLFGIPGMIIIWFSFDLVVWQVIIILLLSFICCLLLNHFAIYFLP